MAKKKQSPFGGGINSHNPTPQQDDDLYKYYGTGNGGYGGPDIWGPSPFASQPEPGRGAGYQPNGYFPEQGFQKPYKRPTQTMGDLFTGLIPEQAPNTSKGRGSNGARTVKAPKKKQ